MADPHSIAARGEWRPSVAEALDAFLSDLELEGRSPLTRDTYHSLLRPLREATELSPEVCRDYVTRKVRSGKLSSAGTAHGALSSFCKWMVLRGYLVASPMLTIPRPPKPQPFHRYLSSDEIQRLFDAANPPLQLAILVLLEGLRVSEACGLRWSDVDLDRGVATVYGKGKKFRLVPLGEDLQRRLRERSLRVAPNPQRAADLDSMRSATILGLTPNALRLRLRRLGDRVGVARVHPHLLRHSFASHSLRQGMSPVHLQTLGGWSKAETMQVYIRSVMADAALEEGRRLGLTARLLPSASLA